MLNSSQNLFASDCFYCSLQDQEPDSSEEMPHCRGRKTCWCIGAPTKSMYNSLERNEET